MYPDFVVVVGNHICRRPRLRRCGIVHRQKVFYHSYTAVF